MAKSPVTAIEACGDETRTRATSGTLALPLSCDGTSSAAANTVGSDAVGASAAPDEIPTGPGGVGDGGARPANSHEGDQREEPNDGDKALEARHGYPSGAATRASIAQTPRASKKNLVAGGATGSVPHALLVAPGDRALSGLPPRRGSSACSSAPKQMSTASAGLYAVLSNGAQARPSDPDRRSAAGAIAGDVRRGRVPAAR